MKRTVLVLAMIGAVACPAAAQPKPLLDLGPSSKTPAAGTDSAGRALAGSLRQSAQGLSGTGAVGEARAAVRNLAAALLESADSMGPEGSERAVQARTLARGLDEIDGRIGALDSAAANEIASVIDGAVDALKNPATDPYRLVRDALAAIVPTAPAEAKVDAWGAPVRAAAPDAAQLGALPGMTGEARAAIPELMALLRDASGHPAYAPSAGAVSALLAGACALPSLPAWVPAEPRAAMGARVAAAIVALARGEQPEAARDALVDVAAELRMVKAADGADLGAQATKVQRALAAALGAAESQEREARLKNFARLLPLVRSTQDLPDEKLLIRQVRPAYRVLRATLTGTRARLLLALPDVIDKALASTDPGLVTAINAHKEALEEAQRLAAVSALLAEPGRESDPATNERWKHIADQLLKLGQEMARPDSRSKAIPAHHDLLVQVQRYASFPGEEELAAAARGFSSAGLHTDSWRTLTGGKAAELAARIGAARSRWSVAVGAKGTASEGDVRRMEELRELMRVASALAALDVDAQGRPGAGYGVLRAWAAWELSPDSVSALAQPVAKALPELVGAAIDPKEQELTGRIVSLSGQAGVLVSAGELARAAIARGIGPGPVLLECAIGGPPPDAWMGREIASVQQICRYAEEAAAARKLGDSARTTALEAYIAKVSEDLKPDAP